MNDGQLTFPKGLSAALNRLRNLDINFEVAIDIGAHKGEWALVFKRFFPHTKVYSFEANLSVFDELIQRNPDSTHALLGRSNGVARTLYFPSGHGVSLTGVSLYKELGHDYDKPVTLSMVSRTLDSFNLDCDYLKLDVQGAELEVLEGSERTLTSAKFVQLECSILQFNHGAPLIAEILAFMHSRGFVVFDLIELMYFNGRVNQIDIILCRKNLESLLSIR